MEKVYLLAAEPDHFQDIKKHLTESVDTLVSSFENINILTFRANDQQIEEIRKLTGVIAIEEDRSFNIDDPL
ncbi:hypothetical protein [Jiulongibacter sediminis]|jgi:nitrate reductase NapAB chaperone NapD|uniref:hypothetical protein n=1 Tax=Jiulongibacter sediminis TaxID=1605367 RepID=UPI0026ED1C40|nr:hypothetical protein [Jiulongibacter sediminis]